MLVAMPHPAPPFPGTPFPDGRAATRTALLEAVESVRDVVARHAEEAERSRTLPPPVVEALRDSGLFALKLPRALGGAEADPVTQIDVIEALTAIDASAGWCLMIGASAIGSPGAFLPDAGVARMFAGPRLPTGAGAIMPTGSAERVAGGYRVTGRWAFASGVRHAEWMSAAARINGSAGELRRFSFPVADAVIHDTWHVVGLSGTGSCDVSVADCFVPEELSWDAVRARPQRGGPLYALGLPAAVANEHVAFALGVARRALSELTAEAGKRARGFRQPGGLAQQSGIQHLVAESDLRLRAARALAVELNEAAWAQASAGHELDGATQAELRAVATLATDVGLDVVQRAFRAAGGSALYLGGSLQRCLRDLTAGAQHLMVSDRAYEALGQFMLGIPGADAMA
jgi:alkylation response protein AidB-like acyl-CoA dehydrogenase